MLDFDAMRREQEAWRREAKTTLVEGMDPADMRKGQVVTVSPNLRVPDRSYTEDLWRVVAFNSTHFQVQALNGYWADREPRIMLFAEHHVYDASEFILSTPADSGAVEGAA